MDEDDVDVEEGAGDGAWSSLWSERSSAMVEPTDPGHPSASPNEWMSV